MIGVTSLFSFLGRIESVDLAGEAGTLGALRRGNGFEDDNAGFFLLEGNVASTLDFKS